MGRRPSLNWKKEVVGLKRGPWTAEEDKILTAYIQQHGHGNWRALPEKAGLQRCGKSCRLRWINYLRPDIKRGKFSLQEEQTIIQLHALLGNRWSVMAAHLPKRTDNEIKNHWNTHLKKRLIKLGVDPMTHKPRTDYATSFPSGSGKKASNLSHMAQWESARLEAEARLVRESKQVVPPNPNSVAPKNHVTCTSTTQLRPRCLDVLKAWQGVVAGMFAFSSQDLGSPTSTLSIPDGTVHQTPAIGLTTTSYTDKSSAGWGAAMKLDGQNILKCIDKKSNQMQQVEETIMDSYMDLHGVTSSSEIEAWFEDSFRVGNYANVEGLSDALTLNSDVLNSPIAVEKSTESCGGNILDHTNCWDNVLSLANSPYDSFVFWPQCQPEFNFNGSSEI